MAEEPESEVPEGAAVFPLIPAELVVDPRTLAILHAMVFLAGSDPAVVNPAAAGEACEFMAGYLQRLKDRHLEEIREDLDCLIRYARHQKWPKQLVRSLESFLADCGIPEKESSHGD